MIKELREDRTDCLESWDVSAANVQQMAAVFKTTLDFHKYKQFKPECAENSTALSSSKE